MLELKIVMEERFDDEKQEFVDGRSETVLLEHSLLSVSKWESKWEVPFLSTEVKTTEQILDYVMCMICSGGISPEAFVKLQTSYLDKVNDYINAKMTATWFRESNDSGRNRQVITNELIYYWMTAFQIPFECENWHLARLLTLIRVCNEKNQPEKKVSPQEAAAQRKLLNEQRRAEMKSRG